MIWKFSMSFKCLGLFVSILFLVFSYPWINIMRIEYLLLYHCPFLVLNIFFTKRLFRIWSIWKNVTLKSCIMSLHIGGNSLGSYMSHDSFQSIFWIFHYNFPWILHVHAFIFFTSLWLYVIHPWYMEAFIHRCMISMNGWMSSSILKLHPSIWYDHIMMHNVCNMHFEIHEYHHKRDIFQFMVLGYFTLLLGMHSIKAHVPNINLHDITIVQNPYIHCAKSTCPCTNHEVHYIMENVRYKLLCSFHHLFNFFGLPKFLTSNLLGKRSLLGIFHNI